VRAAGGRGVGSRSGGSVVIDGTIGSTTGGFGLGRALLLMVVMLGVRLRLRLVLVMMSVRAVVKVAGRLLGGSRRRVVGMGLLLLVVVPVVRMRMRVRRVGLLVLRRIVRRMGIRIGIVLLLVVVRRLVVRVVVDVGQGLGGGRRGRRHLGGVLLTGALALPLLLLLRFAVLAVAAEGQEGRGGRIATAAASGERGRDHAHQGILCPLRVDGKAGPRPGIRRRRRLWLVVVPHPLGRRHGESNQYL